MILEQYFLNWEAANRLKRLGFQQPCLMYWDPKGELRYHQPPHYSKSQVLRSTPMIEQFLDWCFQQHGIYGSLERHHTGWEEGWAYNIYRGDLAPPEDQFSLTLYPTREPANRALIETILTLLEGGEDQLEHI